MCVRKLLWTNCCNYALWHMLVFGVVQNLIYNSILFVRTTMKLIYQSFGKYNPNNEWRWGGLSWKDIIVFVNFIYKGRGLRFPATDNNMFISSKSYILQSVCFTCSSAVPTQMRQWMSAQITRVFATALSVNDACWMFIWLKNKSLKLPKSITEWIFNSRNIKQLGARLKKDRLI